MLIRKDGVDELDGNGSPVCLRLEHHRGLVSSLAGRHADQVDVLIDVEDLAGSLAVEQFILHPRQVRRLFDGI